MKMSFVFLLLGFFLIMAHDSGATVPDPHPVSCCFKFFSGKIPPQHILNMKQTDRQCAQQGFIVSTPKFSRLCVRENPKKPNSL
ncbi:C-C motif chemokine 14-like [Silurus meridionalis]|uniref:Chemokine interleukin-8-like domain-containing protein n=1 Tax=Silurus meridionalis TaxID=175797 RepID=A0A8T0BKW5_SILME|nr:C-C motif chemokine 14-like [Silurus meridionalis]KAF7707728.1 hypothetical protein HF521_018946 [Silurus meridionalis]